jgi:hypothetical protein
MSDVRGDGARVLRQLGGKALGLFVVVTTNRHKFLPANGGRSLERDVRRLGETREKGADGLELGDRGLGVGKDPGLVVGAHAGAWSTQLLRRAIPPAFNLEDSVSSRVRIREYAAQCAQFDQDGKSQTQRDEKSGDSADEEYGHGDPSFRCGKAPGTSETAHCAPLCYPLGSRDELAESTPEIDRPLRIVSYGSFVAVNVARIARTLLRNWPAGKRRS